MPNSWIKTYSLRPDWSQSTPQSWALEETWVPRSYAAKILAPSCWNWSQGFAGSRKWLGLPRDQSVPDPMCQLEVRRLHKIFPGVITKNNFKRWCQPVTCMVFHSTWEMNKRVLLALETLISGNPVRSVHVSMMSKTETFSGNFPSSWAWSVKISNNSDWIAWLSVLQFVLKITKDENFSPVWTEVVCNRKIWCMRRSLTILLETFAVR